MMSQLCLLSALALGQANDPVFDVPALLKPPLAAKVLKTTESKGIVTEEIKFHSHKDEGKSVDIFAFFSYPKGATKLPAFVWNQGGLYQATTYWTEFGARRGYATLCIDFPIGGYRSTGGYPINSGVELEGDPKKAPIYHGAVALLRAVSFLESRPEVDRDRIGMAGSSWGGFYTTLMTGLDRRIKVGSSMFGSGGLQLGNAWWDGQGRNPKRDDAFRKRWQETLDPALRLADCKTPIAWFTATNDSFYWLPAVMYSYERAAGPKHLALLPNWNHGLTPTLDEQVFVWLDIHLNKAEPFLKVSPLERSDKQVAWTFEGKRKAVRAEAIISYGKPGNWHHRHWIAVPAQIKDGRCTATLPPSPQPSFVIGSLYDSDGFLSSTPTLEVPATDAKAALVVFNGCEPWGGFEDKGIEFLKLHGLPTPAVIKTPKTGEQAAQLKPGQTSLAPIHFLPGVPHQFTAFVKSDKATKVKFTLRGSFDGKPLSTQKDVDVGTDWTPVQIDFTPPEALSPSMQAVIDVPAGTSVVLDDVRFSPKK